MKMRLAWYAGASAAVAAATIVSAFHQRANFYSAMVHLAQSNISLISIVNLVFVVYGTLMYGLQRLAFGPLRPVEIEQLYEKAWFAITETCLAMTIFREEVGAWFLVMFTFLVTGKVWGWIGEGRVEVLEQQPPANPRLFHTRLSISLLLSISYDLWFLGYAVNTVVQEARPSMMVMFLFEFAVLSVCSFQTGFRYIVSLVEQRVIQVQTRQRLEDRRRQIREERAEILRRRETEGVTDGDDTELPSEDDVEEMDIEVPGWEAKGQWVLMLDLIADFVKLGIYTAFFCVLFAFYGLPIHIVRDWFVTTRSFLKRLSALIRYRQALRDMDQYPDATAEDLGREDTCIICREEMHPWVATDTTQVERTRAKKLPCGHILHFGCLKSWLERQQVCPICRRPVTRDGDQPARNGDAMVFRLGLNFPAGQNQPPANAQAPDGQAPQGAPPRNQDGNGNQNQAVRMFNLGPLRLGFAQGGVNEIQEMAQRLGMPADAVNPPAVTPPAPAPEVNPDPGNMEQIRAQLLQAAQRVHQDQLTLHSRAHEVQTMSYLVNEIIRLRQQQQQHMQQHHQQSQGQQMAHQASPAVSPPPQGLGLLPHQPLQMPPLPQMFPPPAGQLPMVPQGQPYYPFAPRSAPTITRHAAAGHGTAIPAGSPDLPEGVVLPPGWSLLPLQRLDGGAPPADSIPPISQPLSSISIQDVFRTLSSPLPAGESSSTLVGQDSEPTGTASLPADSSSSPRGAHVSVPSESTESSQPHQAAIPPVTAPTPVAPNWGGSSQLFGGGSTRSVLDYPREGIPETHDGVEGGAEGRAANGLTEENSASSFPESTQNGAASDKGKAKAVTVEEADDDEDEE
ncbi:hypothetical protein B0H63DRAFT_308666 [Podospora didyma]|uniref:RING-type E3 ubiquitin transferase n=1 Tax=Podospora didyma TaxID=330526 RepID=A0AAE0N4P2_9PEZI|nr:hypothetical protein B0H63DRAFT_308666 [Podospora didyma]